MKSLIRMGYSRFPFDSREVVGGPAWIDADRFDIVATMALQPQVYETGLPAGLAGMLRSALEQRLGVKTHNEQRAGLSIGSPGSCLGRASRSRCSPTC